MNSTLLLVLHMANVGKNFRCQIYWEVVVACGQLQINPLSIELLLFFCKLLKTVQRRWLRKFCFFMCISQ